MSQYIFPRGGISCKRKIAGTGEWEEVAKNEEGGVKEGEEIDLYKCLRACMRVGSERSVRALDRTSTSEVSDAKKEKTNRKSFARALLTRAKSRRGDATRA